MSKFNLGTASNTSTTANSLNLGNGLFNAISTPQDSFMSVEKEFAIDLELAADLLAINAITPKEYFKAKAMLKSMDYEVVKLGRVFLDTKTNM